MQSSGSGHDGRLNTSQIATARGSNLLVTIPEPGPLLLLAGGVVMLGFRRQRKGLSGRYSEAQVAR